MPGRPHRRWRAEEGFIQCGVNTGLAGFAQPDSDGEWRGINVDLCRAVAAALFGDAKKNRFTPLAASSASPPCSRVKSIFSRATPPWTFARDAGAQAYNRSGSISTTVKVSSVTKKRNIKSAKQLNGAAICVQPGTAAELNMADYFRAEIKMKFKPVVIEKLEEVLNAYFTGRCDVFPTDVSGLVAVRAARATRPGRSCDLAGGDLEEPSVRWCAMAMTIGMTSSGGFCSP